MAVAVEQYANLNVSLGQAQTTVNEGGGMGAADASVTVAGHTGFPAAAQYRILIDNELILVTAGAGTNTWAITRGIEGTTAATHANGATVTHVLTAGGLLGVGGSINLSGADASLPANGTAGRTYYPNDNSVIYREDGNTWSTFGPVWPLTPVIDANYAWINQGSATDAATKSTVYLSSPADAADSMKIRKKSAPATPYKVTAAFIPFVQPVSSPTVGLCFRESSTSKLVVMRWGYDAGAKNLFIDKYTNETTFSARYKTLALLDVLPWNALTFLRMADDGTNLLFSVSPDGLNFTQIFSVSRTDFMAGAPNEVGFFVNPLNASNAVSMNLLSWKES